MDSVLTSDIFFFITSLAVIFLTILMAVLITVLIKILQQIRSILTKIEAGTDAVSDDLRDLRSKLRSKGIMSALFVGLMSLMPRIEEIAAKRAGRGTNKEKN